MHSPMGVALVLVVLLVTPARQAVAVGLEPFLGGLASPLYLASARDGSGRLFVVEQAGVIRVVAPGGATAVFLDIRDRVLAGGERGLLGLAFHPRYADNGRFFVDYTRVPDGATVVAEYRRSADPDRASPAEIALLTIDQPFANHNGGMVEFGPDGRLYIGMGDGGSANDPGNRAQDVDSLLGKILRIDVDAAAPYAIPPDNPFAGPVRGRDEIYALGLRNPFRFSFDRVTGQLWVGDVGQEAWEEVDVVARGDNLGWRVFEGNHCTGNDPGACNPAAFTAPVAEYAHVGGRCSVTGGRVYRGARGTLPAGTYVFADFCTGEIFALSGGATRLVLDTGLQIAALGEDESGELYVVNLGGTVQRLVPGGPAAVVAAVLPSSRSVRVGTPATAFATIVNASGVAATGCILTLPSALPARFTFQTTDPATNAVTGTPDTAVAIAPGGSQSFVFAITPIGPVDSTPVAIGFQCDNGPAAPLFDGVNTLRLTASVGPAPDIVALVAPPPGSGGVVTLAPLAGSAAFGVATVNLGAGGPITATAEATASLPLVLAICPTDAAGGCVVSAADRATVDVPPGATPSFAVFVTAAAPIPFDPAASRIRVRFADGIGVIRGETSIAVRSP